MPTVAIRTESGLEHAHAYAARVCVYAYEPRIEILINRASTLRMLDVRASRSFENRIRSGDKSGEEGEMGNFDPYSPFNAKHGSLEIILCALFVPRINNTWDSESFSLTPR